MSKLKNLFLLLSFFVIGLTWVGNFNNTQAAVEGNNFIIPNRYSQSLGSPLAIMNSFIRDGGYQAYCASGMQEIVNFSEGHYIDRTLSFRNPLPQEMSYVSWLRNRTGVRNRRSSTEAFYGFADNRGHFAEFMDQVSIRGNSFQTRGSTVDVCRRRIQTLRAVWRKCEMMSGEFGYFLQERCDTFPCALEDYWDGDPIGRSMSCPMYDQRIEGASINVGRLIDLVLIQSTHENPEDICDDIINVLPVRPNVWGNYTMAQMCEMNSIPYNSDRCQAIIGLFNASFIFDQIHRIGYIVEGTQICYSSNNPHRNPGDDWHLEDSLASCRWYNTNTYLRFYPFLLPDVLSNTHFNTPENNYLDPSHNNMQLILGTADTRDIFNRMRSERQDIIDAATDIVPNLHHSERLINCNNCQRSPTGWRGLETFEKLLNATDYVDRNLQPNTFNTRYLRRENDGRLMKCGGIMPVPITRPGAPTRVASDANIGNTERPVNNLNCAARCLCNGQLWNPIQDCWINPPICPDVTFNTEFTIAHPSRDFPAAVPHGGPGCPSCPNGAPPQIDRVSCRADLQKETVDEFYSNTDFLICSAWHRNIGDSGPGTYCNAPMPYTAEGIYDCCNCGGCAQRDPETGLCPLGEVEDVARCTRARMRWWVVAPHGHNMEAVQYAIRSLYVNAITWDYFEDNNEWMHRRLNVGRYQDVGNAVPNLTILGGGPTTDILAIQKLIYSGNMEHYEYLLRCRDIEEYFLDACGGVTAPNFGQPGAPGDLAGIGEVYDITLTPNCTAANIEAYILSSFPSSPILGHGNLMMQLGEQYGVNPCFVLGVMRIETAFGTTGRGRPPQRSPCGILAHHNDSYEQALQRCFALMNVSGYRQMPTLIDFRKRYCGLYSSDSSPYDSLGILRGYCCAGGSFPPITSCIDRPPEQRWEAAVSATMRAFR